MLELATKLNLKKLIIICNFTFKEIDEAVILVTNFIDAATRRNPNLIKVGEVGYNPPQQSEYSSLKTEAFSPSQQI